jgi:hypothetical protein
MNNWIFESVDTTFSLCLPENWAEFEDEENTSAFFNQEKWSGNLRITSFFWQDKGNGIDRVSEYIQSELNENPGAELIKIGNFDAAFYSKETEEDCIINYWATGIDNHLLLISFTFDKEFLDTNAHNAEMIVVNNILNSIKILS